MSAVAASVVGRDDVGRSRRAIPTVALVVGLIALLNGLAFSIITPPFQVPDETAHVAYVQHLAENGRRAGEAGRPEFSSEQSAAMNAMGTLSLIGRPLTRTPSEPATVLNADRALERATAKAPRDDGGGPSTASSQPPLFYAVEAIPYKLFSWASLPARLQAMRAVSAIIFAVGAALCALFVAEVLPGRPFAPMIGGLAVALSPYTAFIASGINPDTLLLTLSSATLLLIARAFRRGMTAERGAALAAVVTAGALTKLTFLAFVPGAAIAFAWLVWRDRRAVSAQLGGLRRLLVRSFVAGASLPALFLLWLAATGGALRPPATATPSLPVDLVPAASTRELLSYVWQDFLPRLPFQNDQLGFSSLQETWVKGFAGRYGWLDTAVSGWIATVFRDVLVLLLVGLIVAAIRYRTDLRRHAPELAIYAVLVGALALAIGKSGYDYHRSTRLIFEQPRYLFPVAALYSAAVAAACLAVGRRAAPLLAMMLVALLCLHNLSGVVTVLARYNG